MKTSSESPPEKLQLHTNFGTIDVAACTAPHLAWSQPFETQDIDRALSIAESEGCAVMRGLSVDMVKDISSSIFSSRMLPLPKFENNFAVIRPQPNATAIAATDKYLALHSDNAHIRRRPRFIFFFMEHQSARGGESIIATFKELEPLLDRLAVPEAGIKLLSVPSTREDRKLAQRIFRKDGPWRDIAYSPFARFYEFQCEEDFRMFSEVAHSVEETLPRYVVKLESGDAMVLDNKRCLHGRLAFSGERVARRIWFS